MQNIRSPTKKDLLCACDGKKEMKPHKKVYYCASLVRSRPRKESQFKRQISCFCAQEKVIYALGRDLFLFFPPPRTPVKKKKPSVSLSLFRMRGAPD